MNCDPKSLMDEAACIFRCVPPAMYWAILIYIACHKGGTPVPVAPVLTVDVPNSVASDTVILNWTGGSPSSQTQIFKCINGGDFSGGTYSLYATVMRSTYTDTTIPAAIQTNPNSYKVQPSGMALSNEVGIGFTINLGYSNPGNFPTMVLHFGAFTSNSGCPAILNVPAMIWYGGFHALTYPVGFAHINFNPAVQIDPHLGNLGTLIVNASLDVDTVNAILMQCAAAPLAPGQTITLKGGDAAPTDGGLIAKAALIASGVTVNTN